MRGRSVKTTRIGGREPEIVRDRVTKGLNSHVVSVVSRTILLSRDPETRPQRLSLPDPSSGS